MFMAEQGTLLPQYSKSYRIRITQMVISADISGCSIVFLGKFNPAIFHPAWLHSKGIEVDESELSGDVLTSRDFTQFSLDTRTYSVQADRFHVETLAAPWVKLVDIATMIFGEYLHHTPIFALGINRDVHFRLPNASSRIRLGRKLAPLEPWGSYGEGMDAEDRELTGGLQTLTMRRKSKLVDGHIVQTNATIEPSVRIMDNSAVYIRVNSHHEFSNLPEGHGSEVAIDMLAKHFEPAMEEAETIIDTLMQAGIM